MNTLFCRPAAVDWVQWGDKDFYCRCEAVNGAGVRVSGLSCRLAAVYPTGSKKMSTDVGVIKYVK